MTDDQFKQPGQMALQILKKEGFKCQDIIMMN